MASYELDTKISPGEVLQHAEAFFGESGLGLSLSDEGPGTRTWQGGGGAVWLTVHEIEKGSRIEIATTEWDARVREFMGRLRKRRLPLL
jgi:hypothetical protein